VKKLLKILFLALVVLLTTSPHSNTAISITKNDPGGSGGGNSVTHTIVCDSSEGSSTIVFTYSPGNPTPGLGSLNLHIDTKGLISPGDFIVSASEYSGEGTLVSTTRNLTITANKSAVDVSLKPKIENIFGAPTNDTAEKTWQEGTITVEFGREPYGVGWSGSCNDSIDVLSPGETSLPEEGATTPAQSCTINFRYNNGKTTFTPTELINFNVSGLDTSAGAPEKRGIVLINKQNNSTLLNGCVNGTDIADSSDNSPDKIGYTIHTDRYGSYLPTGNYNLRITHDCFLLANTADGPNECTPKDFNVCAGDNCTPKGETCTPDNKDTSVNENKCGSDAPFCNVNNDPSNGKGKYVCSTAPSFYESCHDNHCDTAIGSFGFDPSEFAKSVLQTFLALGGVILLFMIILNGYRFMTSQGDPEKVKEAREGIISALSGLLLIILSIVILQFITIDLLHLPGFQPIK
jgi:hypothetical protein